MNAAPLAIPDVLLLEPMVFGDDRGFSFESFSQAKFEAGVGRQVSFVQDNRSRSAQRVVRGLPYQIQQPQAVNDAFMQGKLICGMRHRKSGVLFPYGHSLLRLEEVWGIRL